MAAPADDFLIYATSQEGSTVTSHVVALPTGYAAGDRLIIITRPGSTTTFSTPSGWDLLASRSSTGVTYIFTKIAAGTEGSSVTISSGGSSVRSASIAIAVRGGTDVEATFLGSNANELPTVAPSWVGDRRTLQAIAILTNRRSDSDVWGPPGDYGGLWLGPGGGAPITISQASNTGTTRSRVSAAFWGGGDIDRAIGDGLAFMTTGTIDNPHSAVLFIAEKAATVGGEVTLASAPVEGARVLVAVTDRPALGQALYIPKEGYAQVADHSSLRLTEQYSLIMGLKSGKWWEIGESSPINLLWKNGDYAVRLTGAWNPGGLSVSATQASGSVFGSVEIPLPVFGNHELWLNAQVHRALAGPTFLLDLATSPTGRLGSWHGAGRAQSTTMSAWRTSTNPIRVGYFGSDVAYVGHILGLWLYPIYTVAPLTMSDGDGGIPSPVLAADFNDPSFIPIGGTSGTDDAGRSWTLHDGAAIVPYAGPATTRLHVVTTDSSGEWSTKVRAGSYVQAAASHDDSPDLYTAPSHAFIEAEAD